jgi:hypothetical protein
MNGTMRRLSVLLLCAAGCAAPSAHEGFRLSCFQVDATPPIGHRFVGWSVRMDRVEAPLLLKGVLIRASGQSYVVASLDWCRLHGGAYDLIRDRLAAAADTPSTHVALQCTHTHGAPIADTNAQRLLDALPGAPVHCDVRFIEDLAARAGRALAERAAEAAPFTHVGFGRAKVERYASSRRIPGPDGKLRSRMSACRDPALAALPEGTIDPWLRTVTFFAHERPLVRLHYYATHPQSHYGAEASPDVPGFARERLEREEGIPHLYFTGCGGDVAAGKYNDGSEESRRGLVERLIDAMRRSIGATRRELVSRIEWKTAEVRFAPRVEPAFSEASFRRQMADAGAPEVVRLKAALAVAWYERLKTRPAVELSLLKVGPVAILHLPGEAFVEYQLYAHSLRPDGLLAVAAYGEGGPGYICTDAAFAEGGYEPGMSLVGPPSEARLKAAIRELLR